MNATPTRMVRCSKAVGAVEASLHQHYLESHGIPARIGEGSLAVAVGQLTPDSLHIDVWVPADRLEDARRLLGELRRGDEEQPAADRAGWTCGCGAQNAGDFDLCYGCGAPRPAS